VRDAIRVFANCSERAQGYRSPRPRDKWLWIGVGVGNGLKFSPFSPEVPTEALYLSAKIENFCWRIEQAHLREGGWALIHGDAGSGKSVVLRVLAERLARLADLNVGVVHHPQSNLSDFYRELGEIFGVSIRVSNRWGGFKALRTRWLDHLGSTTRRSVLLCDLCEAIRYVKR